MLQDLIMVSWDKIGMYVLNIIYLIIILIAGGLVARGIQIAVSSWFKLIGLDKLAQKIDFDKALERGSIKINLSEILGNIAFWLVVFMVIVSVINLSGHPGAKVIDSTLSYLYINVGSAILVLIVALILAAFVSRTVLILASCTNLPSSLILARTIKYMIILVGIIIALVELGISKPEFAPAFTLVVGGVCLGLAIAFGLGCKDIVADFFFKLFREK